MSKFILDTRLSEAHYILCTEAIRRGIIEPEDLNEGRRTMAEQWAFFRNQPPLAAFPSPFAPHIKKGFANHAIDGNSINGAIQRLAKFYEEQGVDVAFNVPGEAWHMDTLSQAQLRAAAKRIRRERDSAVLVHGERSGAVRFLKHQLDYIRDPQTRKKYYKPGESKPDKGWSRLYDKALVSAVKRFQKDHGLTPDGQVGPKTDRLIDKAYATQKRRRRDALDRARVRKESFEKGEL